MYEDVRLIGSVCYSGGCSLTASGGKPIAYVHYYWARETINQGEGRRNIAHVEGRVEETLHMLRGGWRKHCTC